MNNNTMILQQGYKNILIAAIVSIVMLVLDCEFLGSVAILATLFLLFVYRNPNRHIYVNTEHLLAPVDGIVEAIDKSNDEVKIYCKVRMYDVHNVKAPISGELKLIKEQKGLNLNPNSYKGSILNEQLVCQFEKNVKEKNITLKLQLIGGFCNSKIELIEKNNIEQGENISVFTDGIAILTLQNNEELNISIGDKIVAGQTVISTY